MNYQGSHRGVEKGVEASQHTTHSEAMCGICHTQRERPYVLRAGASNSYFPPRNPEDIEYVQLIGGE